MPYKSALSSVNNCISKYKRNENNLYVQQFNQLVNFYNVQF